MEQQHVRQDRLSLMHSMNLCAVVVCDGAILEKPADAEQVRGWRLHCGMLQAHSFCHLRPALTGAALHCWVCSLASDDGRLCALYQSADGPDSGRC